ncbi:MAG: transglycosylase domain-containing protein, partial [Actinomycetota bacterium]|nr:transglycosylase domain-containing protein [Actinomycetota bacterium]
MLVLVLATTVGASTFVAGLLAAPIDLAVAPPPSSVLLLAADGRQFATLQPTERHENVRAEDIPQVMRDAIISAEDERFLTHSGVDVLATVRAAFRDLTGSSVQQGGSTLTQQYVKNAYVGNERTALRKIREAALALRLENKLSKQEILTDYLNALYLGNGLYGVQAASRYYFGVPVKDLDLNTKTHKRDTLLAMARASMLAGVAPAPSVWNPVKDFDTARIRQRYTLNRMVVGGFASPQQASDSYQYDVHPLRIRAAEAPTIAPEFADYVKARVKASEAYDEDTFFRGRLRVKTTLDLDLQLAFNEALRQVLPDADDPQAAIVAIDYTTGDVKAMSTLRRVPALRYPNGSHYSLPVTRYEQRLGFNLATAAHRSTGSTIKPFTLAVA